MELYFTTSAGQDLVQIDPKISLGGYKSASRIPNSSFGNLFDEVSLFTLSRDFQEEYIGLILKNESLEDLENLWIYFVYPEGCYSKFLIAAVDLAIDANGYQYMEHITDRFSKPLNADFYEANGLLNAVEIGTVESGHMIGLWICRQLNSDLKSTVIDESNLFETDPTNTDIKRTLTREKSDSISIHFRYGDEYYGGPIGGGLL